ncbi:hypothetical protein ACTM2I_002080, partial [Cronobacter turicensis]
EFESRFPLQISSIVQIIHSDKARYGGFFTFIQNSSEQSYPQIAESYPASEKDNFIHIFSLSY